MSEKIVMIMNKAISSGKIMNAVAHMCISLGYHAFKEDNFIVYKDKEEKQHFPIAKDPVIILSSNQSKLKKAREQAIEQNIFCIDFIESMTEGTWEEQLEKTKTLSEDAKNYFGILLKGEFNAVHAITRKFSLWQ